MIGEILRISMAADQHGEPEQYGFYHLLSSRFGFELILASNISPDSALVSRCNYGSVVSVAP
jgi:hypothetical protein